MAQIMRGEVFCGRVKYMRTVTYSLRTGKFSANLPPECEHIAGVRTISADSMKELEVQFAKISATCRENQTSTRKVIGYCVSIYNIDLGLDQTHSRAGTTLSVAACVFNEEKSLVSGNKSYKEVDSTIPEALSFSPTFFEDEMVVIDWTSEREAFFASLGGALNQLCGRIHEFMSDGKQLIALIDRGERILPPPKEEAAPGG